MVWCKETKIDIGFWHSINHKRLVFFVLWGYTESIIGVFGVLLLKVDTYMDLLGLD